MLLEPGVFTLLGGELRVHVLELLGGDEAHALFKLRQHGKLRVNGLHGALGVADGGDNVHDGGLEVIQVPVLRQDDLLPVPLVDVDRVEVVQLVLVAADGVHVGIQALARPEVVALERHALPLGKALHDLGSRVGVQDIEGDRALIAVEVVVQAGIFVHEQRRGDAVEIEPRAQIVREDAL